MNSRKKKKKNYVTVEFTGWLHFNVVCDLGFILVNHALRVALDVLFCILFLLVLIISKLCWDGLFIWTIPRLTLFGEV